VFVCIRKSNEKKRPNELMNFGEGFYCYNFVNMQPSNELSGNIMKFSDLESTRETGHVTWTMSFVISRSSSFL
jgi:hypothetical protein